MTGRWLADRSSRRVVLLAGALGFLLWALSPWLLGVSEPWDSGAPVYPVTLLVGGLLAALLASRWEAILLGFLGVWLGQVAALALLPGFDKGWLLLGVVTTAIGSLIFFVGMGIGFGLRRALR